MADPYKEPLLAVIGGSGIYDIDGLADTRWVEVETPFGKPSDALLHGSLHGQPLVFLPRHGRGHGVLPTDINFRANIDALKRVGVTDILSMSAVGSLREDLAPGAFVIIDQFIDRSFARAKTFSATASPPMSPWPIRSAAGLAGSSRRRRRKPVSGPFAAAPIW